jgi:predicted component of type VI protein secretion system
MKVNLIVTAAGPNNGRAIPIIGAKFLIGRDPQCHLRPASQAISKLHCAILIRDGKVFAQDFGSTNGTQIDGEAFTGERELTDGCAMKMGPLEFKVQILLTEKRSDSTPLPDALKPLSSSAAVSKLAAAAGQPAAKKPASSPGTPRPSGVTKPVAPAATKPVAPAPVPITPAPGPAADGESSDDIDAAAMLLGMEDDSPNPTVPGGSTVHELPAVNADGTPVKKPDPKKKATPSGAEMSAAANDILRKYIRRTGN